LGSGVYSEKLLAGARHRFSGFNQPRQCGDDVLRILVTGVDANSGPRRQRFGIACGCRYGFWTETVSPWSTSVSGVSFSSRDPPCERCFGVKAQDNLSRGRHEVLDEAGRLDHERGASRLLSAYPPDI
jgi:hypothetical protein